MTISIKGVVALSLTCIAVDAFATVVSESDVRKAAEAFVSADPIGSAVLGERSIVAVRESNGIWIVGLSPHGHVILSGSDLNDPIVGFSSKDFVEPDPESPACAVLEGARAAVREKEEKGEEDRNAKWTALLGNGRPILRASPVDNPSPVIVPPFLMSHYNQCQPYNDYAPVYDAAANTASYRGRCPCGCVATATAQVFRHFRWPARIDRIDSFVHSFTDANNVEGEFPLRFDGHLPIDWAALEDAYTNKTSVCVTNYYQGGYSWRWEDNYDLRGTVPETTRYPIARLIMFADVLAGMSFKSGGSSSNYDTVADNVSDWYVGGSWVNIEEGISQVRADMLAGVPCQVSIGAYNQSGQRYKGHEVVAHGWAESGSTKYVYINFGWGGSNDGYYNVADGFQEYQEKKVYVGHYPRAKPQIDPLPKVSDTNLTLSWHFPDFYTNKLSGFTVLVSKTATTTSTFLDDFSDTSGISDIENGSINDGELDRIYVATDSNYGSGCGNLLYVEPLAFGHFTYTDKLTLTDSSTLSFRLRSINANACVYEIQARYNDGDWTTVYTPPLSTTPNGYTADSGWQVRQVELIGHSGETAQFRINKEYVWGADYYDNGLILLDDFSVSNVLQQEAPTAFPVDADKRSCEITGLDAGSTYSFTVKPIMSGALVEAEKSDSIATTTAGEILVPVEGEVTYTNVNPAFLTNDDGAQWTSVGTVSGNTVTRNGPGTCSVTAQLKGTLTENSQLTFSWQGQGTYRYNKRPPYVSVSDTLTVSYIDDNNSPTVLTQKTNSAAMSVASACVVPLGGYSGKKGTVKIELSCPTQKTTSTLTISQSQIENVLVQSGPEVTLVPKQIPVLGMPEIRSVSSVSEGFYGECWTNTTTFSVVCSETVETLEARPSHLSLVRDEDVSVSKVGDGTFKVCVTPSGIDESNFRSRMILTLVGTDSNGTKCYKDLSLRFSQVEPRPTEVHVTATTSSGAEFSVEIPYSWLEEKNLVEPNSDVTAYEAALASDADADSDGIPNWAEFVCGTDPSDAADKLTASITMVDGEPVVTYTPADRIASGFKAVIKGTTDLSAALSTWEVVTDTRTSTCRFFRVEIVPGN